MAQANDKTEATLALKTQVIKHLNALVDIIADSKEFDFQYRCLEYYYYIPIKFMRGHTSRVDAQWYDQEQEWAADGALDLRSGLKDRSNNLYDVIEAVVGIMMEEVDPQPENEVPAKQHPGIVEQADIKQSLLSELMALLERCKIRELRCRVHIS